MKPSTSEPERTCVGCRRRAPARELVRLALAPDGLLVTWGPSGTRPAGRGASLHAAEGCLRAALKAGAFARAFRKKLEPNELNLMQQITAATAASGKVNRNKP